MLLKWERLGVNNERVQEIRAKSLLKFFILFVFFLYLI